MSQRVMYLHILLCISDFHKELEHDTNNSEANDKSCANTKVEEEEENLEHSFKPNNNEPIIITLPENSSAKEASSDVQIQSYDNATKTDDNSLRINGSVVKNENIASDLGSEILIETVVEKQSVINNLSHENSEKHSNNLSGKLNVSLENRLVPSVILISSNSSAHDLQVSASQAVSGSNRSQSDFKCIQRSDEIEKTAPKNSNEELSREFASFSHTRKKRSLSQGSDQTNYGRDSKRQKSSISNDEGI